MATAYWELASELGTETVDRWIKQSRKKAMDSYRGKNRYKYPYRVCPHCNQLIVCGSDSYDAGYHLESCF